MIPNTQNAHISKHKFITQHLRLTFPWQSCYSVVNSTESHTLNISSLPNLQMSSLYGLCLSSPVNAYFPFHLSHGTNLLATCKKDWTWCILWMFSHPTPLCCSIRNNTTGPEQVSLLCLMSNIKRQTPVKFTRSCTTNPFWITCVLRPQHALHGSLPVDPWMWLPGPSTICLNGFKLDSFALPE